MPTGVYIRTAAYKEAQRLASIKRGAKPPSPKGTVWSEERKEKLAKKKKGVPRDAAVKEKMSKTFFKTGSVPFNKGKSHLPLEKNPNWKGGKNKKNPTRPRPEQCEVCGAFGKDFKKGLCYDHDHSTGKFRGWLCTRCNVALGMVKDNTELLEALAKYINDSRVFSASGYKGA